MKEQGLGPSKAVLVIRLDQVVMPQETMLEAFWTAASASWLKTLQGLSQSVRNSSQLESRFKRIAYLAPARLRYREDIVETAQSWRAAGGRVALIAQQDSDTVKGIAAYLGVFDDAQGGIASTTGGDDGLDRLYGPGGYSMIAPAGMEPPGWTQQAATLIGSGPSKRETAVAASSSIKAAVRLIRPHQWPKNVLVFVPMLAAHQLTLNALWHSVLAFIAFGLIASSTYVLNDLLDLNADRAHPRKRRRPLASGALSIAHGTLLMPVLALAGIGAALLSGLPLLGALLAYFALTTAYSFRLKRMVAVDICALAVLYTMRILAGTAATGIPASMWLLAFSTFFFFSLAAVKRQAELVDGVAAGRVKTHGRGYHVGDLSIVNNIAVSAGMVSVLVLALYANSEPVQLLYHTPEMLWGVCLVLLFWNSRIAILTHRGQMHDDPLVFAARDRVSLVCAGVVGTLALTGALV